MALECRAPSPRDEFSIDARKYAAVLAGSFLLFTIGCLSVAAFGVGQAPGLLVVPFSFGLGLLAAIFAFGHISARSIGLALIGGDLSKLWVYLVAPLVGAVLGWLAWKLLDGGAAKQPAA